MKKKTPQPKDFGYSEAPTKPVVIAPRDLALPAGHTHEYTIDQAQQRLVDHIHDTRANTCEACGRTVKMSPSRLSFCVLEVLEPMVAKWKEVRGEEDMAPMHIEKLLEGVTRRRSFPKMAYWGLIHQYSQLVFNPVTKTHDLVFPQGLWVVDKKGIDFLEGRINVPLYAFVYLNVVHLVGDMVPYRHAIQFGSEYAES